MLQNSLSHSDCKIKSKNLSFDTFVSTSRLLQRHDEILAKLVKLEETLRLLSADAS